MNEDKTKSGLVSIIGRTNVGKSTLLNHLIEQKVSITSRKPQTTRFRVLGIKTKGLCQAVIIDTPGYHRGHKRALNKYMNKVALSAMTGIDILLFVVEALKWKEEDQFLLQKILKGLNKVILVINKIDKLKQKERLLPYIDQLTDKHDFMDIIPISALKGNNIKRLEKSILTNLPTAEYLYPEEQTTDMTEKFLISETIREKCIARVGQEIPYRITVTIDQFEEKGLILFISATLYVEKKSQKGILIGLGGKNLKSIGTSSRKELERIFQKKVMLKLWVKVKKNWTDNETIMQSMGYRIE
ncbi:MAG: GTPase Era [Gammaproteobacteria bacterium]|nr:GTPase Era [Gammaproteobacteria bacterium]|tara:strand:+ start:1361 stop:2260 length:900 start_codon:yes stop_codon:yes gene_type:complete